MKMLQTQSRRKAFTLTELMVVVLFLAILLAMVDCGPSRSTKRRAMTVACLSIQKQFAAGAFMFANDNQDSIIGMDDQDPSRDWRLRPGPNWGVVTNLKVYDEISANIEADQHGYRISALYPYAKNVEMVHCPSDTRYRSTNFFAYTSYSGNGGFAKSGATKISDVKAPTSRFLWIEENDPRRSSVVFGERTFAIGENVGPWEMNKDSWSDAPAVFHGDSATFSFLDGHAERRIWKDPCTRSIAAFTHPENKPAFARKISLISDGALAEIECRNWRGSPTDLRAMRLGFDGVTVR